MAVAQALKADNDPNHDIGDARARREALLVLLPKVQRIGALQYPDAGGTPLLRGSGTPVNASDLPSLLP